LTQLGADFSIGDHLKTTGHGMTSYKWIEECCRQGELVDADSHKIRGIQKGISGSHRSGRRNEFSAADDRILIDHIKINAARGAHTKGNVIYDSLARAVCSLFYVWLIIVSSSYFSVMEESMG
jgi:hypothetical protein